ncbi:MAG: polyprenyl synthetase family protein [Pseudomonadota bacterium]
MTAYTDFVVSGCAMTRFDQISDPFRLALEEALNSILSDCSANGDAFSEALRYSVLNGGKRLRPLMTLMAAGSFDSENLDALDAACAVEMVHAASLIVDDLPSMDDAQTRRGRPANHLVHGEPTAILASIALMNQAFNVVARSERLSPEKRLAIVEVLSRSVGPMGLAGGQNMDLTARAGPLGEHDPEAVNHAKTGVLFVAALEIGAICANIRDARLSAFREFGRNFGQAYQLLDDFIDVYGDSEAAGKDVGKDDDRVTVASKMGTDYALQKARSHILSMLRAAAPMGPQGRHFRSLLSWLLNGHLPKISANKELLELQARIESA